MTMIDRIFKASEGVQIVDVTPEIARGLLESANYDNRKVKPVVVSKYAKTMSDGDWKFSPETISISKSGRLLNGQHRMLAVIASGVTCRFLFATGFDDDVFSVLDRGAVRTNADALGIDKRLSECAALLCRLKAGNKRGVVTDGDIRRASEAISAAHADLIGFCPTNARVFSSAPFRLAAVARVLAGYDREYVFGLYRDLVLGKTEEMPPIGHATVRATLAGRLFSSGGANQPTNSCVAWDVFNPQSREKSKIIVAFREAFASDIVKATGYE
jgi:hypothetical protein